MKYLYQEYIKNSYNLAFFIENMISKIPHIGPSNVSNTQYINLINIIHPKDVFDEYREQYDYVSYDILI